MPSLPERIAGVLKAWFYDRAVIVVSKAPRERPDLVAIVFILAILLVLSYVYIYSKGF